MQGRFLSFSKQLQSRRRKRVLSFFLKILFIPIFLVGAITLLSSIDYFSLNDVVVRGAKISDANKIKEIAEKEMQGRRWIVLPKKNYLVYPSNDVEEIIRSDLAISDVKVTIEGRRIFVDVRERKDYAIWCSSEEMKDFYFIDWEGVLFRKISDFEGDLRFIYIGGLSNHGLGSSFFSMQVLASFDAFISKSKEIGISYNKAIVAGEREVRFMTKVGPEVKVDPTIDINNQYQNLKTAVSGSGPSISNLNKIEYIDLRFGNRIYYK